MTSRPTQESPVKVLTVCTGNICRSPLAELILSSRFEGDSRFDVSSAGLMAVVGSPMDKHAAQQLRAHGGDSTGHRGTQLSEELVATANLILTMTRSQRDEVIRRYPRAMKRTFTLTEFAMLLEIDTNLSNGPLGLIDFAARNRARVRLTKATDIPDPIDASISVHEAVGNQIVSTIDRIVPRLVADQR